MPKVGGGQISHTDGGGKYEMDQWESSIFLTRLLFLSNNGRRNGIWMGWIQEWTMDKDVHQKGLDQ